MRVCINTSILIDILKWTADFLIGGFATVRCDAILTRDRGIYVKYFPDLIGYVGCLASTT